MLQFAIVLVGVRVLINHKWQSILQFAIVLVGVKDLINHNNIFAVAAMTFATR